MLSSSTGGLSSNELPTLGTAKYFYHTLYGISLDKEVITFKAIIEYSCIYTKFETGEI